MSAADNQIDLEASGHPPEGRPDTGAPEERPARRSEAADAAAGRYGPEDFPGRESFHLPNLTLEESERPMHRLDISHFGATPSREMSGEVPG